MIVCNNLAKNFKKVHAVSDVSFEAEDGKITALLGLNGSGKSTTLRMISGLLKPKTGEALIDNISPARAPRQAQARLGLFPDRFGLYPHLTVREHIDYFGRLHGLAGRTLTTAVDQIAERLELSPILNRRTEGFSTGQSMRTALARALVHDPQNLVLDEPTRGLDVKGVKQLRRVLIEARDSGRCVVFSSHVMPEVERIADHFVIIADGRTVAAGNLQEILSQADASELEVAFMRLSEPGTVQTEGQVQ